MSYQIIRLFALDWAATVATARWRPGRGSEAQRWRARTDQRVISVPT
jgi:hypothetical protein